MREVRVPAEAARNVRKSRQFLSCRIPADARRIRLVVEDSRAADIFQVIRPDYEPLFSVVEARVLTLARR